MSSTTRICPLQDGFCSVGATISKTGGMCAPNSGGKRGGDGLRLGHHLRADVRRHADLERRPLAELTLHGDAPAEHAAELLAEGQSQSRSSDLVGLELGHLPEIAEQLVEILARDADAGVADLDLDPVAGRIAVSEGDEGDGAGVDLL